MTLSDYRLADRYRAEVGRVFLTGVQALARIPLEQLRADRRAGHRTAALVTGYPGSPLAGLDAAVAAACATDPGLPIVRRPAVNEEFAASAVMGSQLAAARPDARYDGVVGLWYGKAPGLDRASDAMRHAVFAGTSRLGGAVAIVGDDPKAKSSTLPSSAAGVLADLHMPLLYPGDPGAVLDLGRHAIALSRACGLWTALKIVADVADSTASVDLDPERVRPVAPTVDGRPFDKVPDGRLLTPHTLDIEREIFEVRYPLAVQYAADNRLNVVTVDPPDAWVGIVASGITAREVREALDRLGLATDDEVRASGIRILTMQMPIPFNPATVRDFARGLDEILVVEEKNPLLEVLVKDALYDAPVRPRVLGRLDRDGRALVPAHGALDADAIVGPLRTVLAPRLGHRLAPLPASARPRIAVAADRSPYFCSGCPHNRSTTVPHGSVVGAGIGCHTMVLYMDAERVGDIAGMTCMGNEGTQWIGMADFVATDHLVQNIGDGTYFHSGQLAITAAVAAKVNITYKLLYNGTIAMTGGQHPEGQLEVARIAANLLGQGVAQVLITTDDVDRYHGVDLPPSVRVWHRDRLLQAQEELARVRGVTVLVHDQACAAETRRARKRDLVATPTRRVAINERVCEGCGDCGRISNCLSVQPVDTPFGRKTQIDHTTCNFDETCLDGDCPSFVTIETRPRRAWRRWGRSAEAAPALAPVEPRAADAAAALLAEDLPEPPLLVTDDHGIRVTGIGGTGVVTVAQVLGTAAMLDGWQVRGLDQIGLSQKAGPVVSDIRLTRGAARHSSRLGREQADLLLACDQLVAASEKGLLTASATRTAVVGSSSPVPTGTMVVHPDRPMPVPADLAATIASVTRADVQVWADAAAITTAVFGDSVTANFFVVGMAVQGGHVPVAPERIEEAIRLNGTAVEANLRAFRLGRRHAVDPAQVDALAHRAEPASPQLPTALAALVEACPIVEVRPLLTRLADDLVGYQDERTARRFLDFVVHVAGREHEIAPGSAALTRAVATNLHRLTAYKDEYEVARLLLHPSGRREIDALAGGTGRVSYRLHPPLLRALGVDRKIALGPWSDPFLRALARGKRLRGHVADPFRWTEVRRAERRSADEYRAAVERVLRTLTADRLDAAATIAGLPDLVRGYESLKLHRLATYRARLAAELAVYESTRAPEDGPVADHTRGSTADPADPADPAVPVVPDGQI